MKKFLVVGAGFSGSIVALKLAELGYSVEVWDQRDHIGGNCFTKRDHKSGIIEHIYGPHIFHTDFKDVWDFVNVHGDFEPYRHSVKTISKGKVFSMPLNLLTISQLYDKYYSPNEALRLIKKESKNIKFARNFEEQALKMMGQKLYETFFKGYTKKQWGVEPKNLPASILKRLPMRFNFDDNYFFHKYQGMPKEGYTPIIESILNHSNIELLLNKNFSDRTIIDKYHHVFYSGGIDRFFNNIYGDLGYRTLDFHRSEVKGNYQGCAVMNYSDEDVPYTRITEHKYFMENPPNDLSIIYKEYSRTCTSKDIPYYPIRLAEEKELLHKYVEDAKKLKNVTFMGRLGTYRYLDMDVTIKEALDLSSNFKAILDGKKKFPIFSNNPL